jgi:hypothetical protein
MNLINAFLSFVGNPSVSVPLVDRAPVIDGVLEECWAGADSVKDFRAFGPYYGSEPSESTKAYLMHDEENLYIAFVCQIKDRAPDVRLTMRDGGTGDEVKVMIDTYGNGITGYRFAVSAAGTQSDARITDDGRGMDFSWDGVWRRGVRVADSSFTVEIAIPFKTIRYGSGPWGICLVRSIPSRSETVMWPLMPQNTDIRMSLMARADIEPPGSRAFHAELYPVALAGGSFVSGEDYSWENKGFDIRYEKGGFYSEAGLDAAWSPTPSTSIQATLNPDFAQVEADPFQLNLTRYELWVEEKRPFFVEGKDIFDSPIRIFYSRRIGAGLSAGAKLTSSGNFLEYGALVARTEPYREIASGDTSDHPAGLYYVGRTKLRLFGNSNIGLMVSGSEEDGAYNRAGCLGLALRGAEWSWKNGFALSDRDGKAGEAALSSFGVSTRGFYAEANAEWSDDSFDVSRIGFYPYSGTTSLHISAGPELYPETGRLSRYRFGIAGGIGREGGEDFWAWGIGPTLSLSARGGEGIELSSVWNRDYEQGSAFWNWNPSLGVYTNWQKPVYLWATAWRSYGYNYKRGYFASQSGANASARYTIRSGLALSVGVDVWVERRPDNSLEAITVSTRPKLSWLPAPGMNLSLYAEPAFTDAALARLVGGAIFSWEFAPKSWFYLVYNHGIENDGAGRMITNSSELQAKVKYLLFI